MSINKYFSDDNKNDYFHSSGYAQAANGSNLGSTDSTAFSQRLNVEKNRQTIRKYRDSHIARQHEQARQFHRVDTATPSYGAETQLPPVASRQETNARGATPNPSPAKISIPPRQAFSEPPKRGYNPFS